MSYKHVATWLSCTAKKMLKISVNAIYDAVSDMT